MSENEETEILTEHTDQWREAWGSTLSLILILPLTCKTLECLTFASFSDAKCINLTRITHT